MTSASGSVRIVAAALSLTLTIGCGAGPATQMGETTNEGGTSRAHSDVGETGNAPRTQPASKQARGFWLSRNSIRGNEQVTLSVGEEAGPSITFDQNIARAVIGRKLELGERVFAHDFKVAFSTAADPAGESEEGTGIAFTRDSGGSLLMNYRAQKPSAREKAAHKSGWRSVRIDRNLLILVIGRDLNRDESAFADEPKVESGPAASTNFEMSVPKVTATELQMFGPKYSGQMVQMTECTFVEVNDTFSPLPNLCGFFVKDRNEDFYTFALAQRDDVGQLLLSLKRGDRLSLLGSVIRLADGKPNATVETKQGEIIDLPRYRYAITGCKIRR